MSKYLHAVIMQYKPTTSASPDQQHSLTNVYSIYTHRQNQLNDMKYWYLRSIKIWKPSWIALLHRPPWTPQRIASTTRTGMGHLRILNVNGSIGVTAVIKSLEKAMASRTRSCRWKAIQASQPGRLSLDLVRRSESGMILTLSAQSSIDIHAQLHKKPEIIQGPLPWNHSNP